MCCLSDCCCGMWCDPPNKTCFWALTGCNTGNGLWYCVTGGCRPLIWRNICALWWAICAICFGFVTSKPPILISCEAAAGIAIGCHGACARRKWIIEINFNQIQISTEPFYNLWFFAGKRRWRRNRFFIDKAMNNSNMILRHIEIVSFTQTIDLSIFDLWLAVSLHAAHRMRITFFLHHANAWLQAIADTSRKWRWIRDYVEHNKSCAMHRKIRAPIASQFITRNVHLLYQIWAFNSTTTK